MFHSINILHAERLELESCARDLAMQTHEGASGQPAGAGFTRLRFGRRNPVAVDNQKIDEHPPKS
jgi:hypothetical protein